MPNPVIDTAGCPNQPRLTHCVANTDQAFSSGNPDTIKLSVSRNFHNKVSVTGNKDDFASNWQAVDWTPGQIIDHILQGRAICVSQLKDGYRDTEHFLSSQIVCTDHDDGPGIEVLSQHPFIRENAFFAHATANSTPEAPRSRVYFVLDEVIRDPKRFRRLVTNFHAFMNELMFKCDPAAKDASRMFYGSANAEHVAFPGNTLPIAFLEELPTADRKRTRSKPQKAAKASPTTLNEGRAVQSEEHRLAIGQRVRSALSAIPPQPGYEVWLAILMAVFSAFPDDFGISLLEEWSPGYPGEVAAKFASFRDDCPDPITLKTLWHIARSHGWERRPEPKPDITIEVPFVTDAELPIDGAIVLKSDMGTGKTEYILRRMAEFQATKGYSPRVLVIAHRTSLISNLCNRLGLENYQGLRTSQLRQAIRLGITPNSLYKLVGGDQPLPCYDLVVVDEAEQVFAHLAGNTFRGGEGVRANNVLKSLMKRAELVLAMDAYAGETTLHYLQDLRSDVTFVENGYHANRGSMAMIDDEDQLLSLLREQIKQATRPIVVMCDERATTEKIVAGLQPSLGEGVRGIHSGNSQDGDTRRFLDNINTELAALQVLVCSPTVGSGIDIQVEVEGVFAFFGGVTLSGDELLQMIGRCRKATQVFVSLARITNNLETDKPTLNRQHYANLVRTGLECGFDPEGRPEANAAQQAYLDLWCEVTARHRQSLNDIYADFVELASRNFTVSWPSIELHGAAQQFREAGKAVEAARRQSILEQPPVNQETYRQCALTGTLTPEIEAGHQRWQIEDAYGLQISDELIDEYDEGRGPEKLERFVALHLPREVLVHADSQEHASGVAIQARGHHTVIQRILKEALSAIFGDTLHVEKIAADDLQARLDGPFSEVVSRWDREIYELLGRRRDQVNEPIHLLRHFLKLVGLRIDHKKSGKHHDHDEWYRLDEAVFARMCELAVAQTTHLGMAVDLAQTRLL